MSSIYKKSSIPKALRDEVWTLTNGYNLIGTCYVCKKILHHNNFEAGHIVSEVTGGPTTIDNLRAVCRPCNRSCSTKNMDEFKQRLTPSIVLNNSINNDLSDNEEDSNADEILEDGSNIEHVTKV